MSVDMFADTGGPSPNPLKAGESEEAQAEGWVVGFRTVGALPPLFCVCAGGGDVFDYRDLALALPEGQPVYGFGVPPIETDNGFPTVQQLAAIYVGAVRRRQPHGPYRLCGHSFGGLVVYEMGVQMANAGEEVGVVALIDTLHPAFKRNMSVMDRVRFQLSYTADRVAKYARDLAKGRIDQVGRNVLDYVRSRCKRAGWKIVRSVSGRQGRRLPGAIPSTEQILVSAWHRYDPGKYAGRLVLLNAAARPPEYRSDSTLGWRQCATGVIDIRVVPGDHYSIMHPPHVRALAERIEPYLAMP
jgi:thioesterase domain-containing protein